MDEETSHGVQLQSEVPQPKVGPEDAKAVPSHSDQVEYGVEQKQRRSSRVRPAPERLNLESTVLPVRRDQHGLYVSQCLHHFLPLRPGGGEGINDDGR